ncbi:erythromycin esterase family protein [Nitrosomonas communis]|uniref:Erythromycin esterase n=1 Tax=Nitrosomonas communis TaxID=44574 RepID=A0A1I4V2H4_9PROT|nr:erythromycin esterase family protein [Nitrosomonas communis]SFM95419.1 Erythromycin esterase [Nitrosomonas communis]
MVLQNLGDAAASEMAQRGEVNIGLLTKEKYGEECLNIGFSTAHGTVTTASDWDGSLETKTEREPLPGSYEELFTILKTREFVLELHKLEIEKSLILLSKIALLVIVVAFKYFFASF